VVLLEWGQRQTFAGWIFFCYFSELQSTLIYIKKHSTWRQQTKKAHIQYSVLLCNDRYFFCRIVNRTDMRINTLGRFSKAAICTWMSDPMYGVSSAPEKPPAHDATFSLALPCARRVHWRIKGDLPFLWPKVGWSDGQKVWLGQKIWRSECPTDVIGPDLTLSPSVTARLDIIKISDVLTAAIISKTSKLPCVLILYQGNVSWYCQRQFTVDIFLLISTGLL
jgi:hypothetical protein